MGKDNVNEGAENSRMKLYISKMRYFLEKKQLDYAVLNSILDDLNALNSSELSAEDKSTFIHLCCSLISSSDTLLIGKCGQVVFKFLQKQNLNDHLALFIIQWCLQALARSPDISQTELLILLEHLFKTHIESYKEIIDNALKTLKHPLENESKLVFPGEILLQRLRCIQAMIPAMNITHIQTVKDILLHLIQNELDSSAKIEVLITELEILQMISEKNSAWLSDNVGVVLAISLSLSSYGLPHHVESIPQYLLPTPLHPDSRADFKKVNKVKGRRKHKKSAAEKIKSAPIDEPLIPEINWSLSESDFSDSENSRLHQSRRSERKVRLSALTLLLYVVKNVGKRELIGYWDSILSGPYSILKTLNSDLSPRSRVAITSILSLLFSTSKIYILQAQHRSSSIPYVSWSQLLADLIVAAHEALCDSFAQPQAVVSMLSILNCLIIFIRNTPYHRLHDGVLKKIVFSITPSLHHVDVSVRNSAIKCIVEIIILEPNTEEQIFLIRCNPVYKNIISTNDSWIISYCLESLKNDKLSITVRAECWLLLGALAKHHFITNISIENLEEILVILRKDLQDSNIMIQKNAAKAFEQIAIPIGSLDSSCGVDCLSIWLSMFQGPLIPMLQSTSGILAAAAADCIANITCSVFEKLPERLRIFIMTALFGCVSHEEHVARSAAVRTLGTIAVFPFLSQDIQIIYDVADRIICAMRDDNLMVKTKAAWALGNLSDVLLSGRKIGVPIEEVPLLNILEMAIQTGNDHEKVKACSMRAIGNLFLLVEEEHLKIRRFQELVEEAASVLNINSSSENNMKVRWNACYSLGNMFKNVLLMTHVDTGWQLKIFESFSKLIVTCTNFKVRQAASTALTMISKREFYGDYYSILWSSLMRAFQNSQNLPDFAEYKHQRNLTDQLCLLFCHLCCFLVADDLQQFNNILLHDLDSVIKYVIELKKRNPEVICKFDEAKDTIEILLRSSNLSSLQMTTAVKLKEVLQGEEICAYKA